MDATIMAAAPELDHLIPAARRTAVLPAAERIQRVRADRWIGYTKANEALGKLEGLFSHPKRQRMPNLLLVGATNNGKSMIVEKFRRTHAAPDREDADQEELPIVAVQMPSEPTVARFYAMLLHSMGAPMRPRARVAELEGLALRILRQVGARMLVIDELHNMLAAGAAAQREFLNLIRFLGNELRIPVVGVGTREAYLAIRSDDQLENRFQPMVLPPWQDDEEFAALLASFAAVLPLRHRSDLLVPDLARFVLDRSEGTIGEITALLTAATVVAIETGEEAITRQVLALAEYEPPSVRRHLFERDLA